MRSEKPKIALYLEAQTLFARGAISLPDHPVLLRELRLLERRTHRSGKDTVDHGWHGHDDYANAVLGCAAHAMRGGGRYRYPANMDWVSGPTDAEEFQRQRLSQHILRTGGYYRQWR